MTGVCCILVHQESGLLYLFFIISTHLTVNRGFMFTGMTRNGNALLLNVSVLRTGTGCVKVSLARSFKGILKKLRFDYHGSFKGLNVKDIIIRRTSSGTSGIGYQSFKLD